MIFLFLIKLVMLMKSVLDILYNEYVFVCQSNEPDWTALSHLTPRIRSDKPIIFRGLGEKFESMRWNVQQDGEIISVQLKVDGFLPENGVWTSSNSQTFEEFLDEKIEFYGYREVEERTLYDLLVDDY